jgi:hypothetical protein
MTTRRRKKNRPEEIVAKCRDAEASGSRATPAGVWYSNLGRVRRRACGYRLRQGFDSSHTRGLC